MGLSSNLERPFLIGRRRAVGCVGRRRDVTGDPVRGGAWPEKGERGLPDSVWAPVWPWRILVECVTHLCT